MTGRVMVRRSAGRRRWPAFVLAVSAIASASLIAITVNPALRPLRSPFFDDLQLPSAADRSASPQEYASFELPFHHGRASSFLAWFHGVAPGHQAEAVMLESSLAIIGAWVIGYSVGLRRAAAASRREQAERLAREQLAEARRASSEERMRIARELHDVVAHSLTLIAVQAGVANHVATRQPEQAAQALSSIEKLSRGALTEMRALLGVLRSDQGEPAAQRPDAVLRPVPGQPAIPPRTWPGVGRPPGWQRPAGLTRRGAPEEASPTSHSLNSTADRCHGRPVTLKVEGRRPPCATAGRPAVLARLAPAARPSRSPGRTSPTSS